MKRLTLLLALPLTVLMAIDFTMTKEGLFTETTTQSPAPDTDTDTESTNTYLEPINLPKCDKDNPEVQFIETNEDWKTINSSSKRIFCVSPGDYRSLGNIKLTTNGTAEKRRYIILNNGNNIHPGKLNTHEVANYSLKIASSSYWTVDRLAAISPNIARVVDMTGKADKTPGSGATHNIINRAFITDMTTAVRFGTDGDSNTLQNSRIQEMKLKDRRNDSMAVIIEGNIYGAPSMTITNTKIINNEIVNTNDGIHIGRHPLKSNSDIRQEGNVAGTIIDSNDIYITPDIYTDGSGNSDLNGNYAYAEDGMDLKVGSNSANNPMIISNNHTWGFRESDTTDGAIASRGDGLMMHLGVYNVIIVDNVLFDSPGGIIGALGYKNTDPYAIKDAVIKRNLLYETGAIINRPAYPLKFSGSKNVVVSDNTIINSRKNYLSLSYILGDTCIKDNIIINQEKEGVAGIDTISTKLRQQTFDCINTNTIDTQKEEYTKDYIFITDIFTNSPKTITLPNAIKP